MAKGGVYKSEVKRARDSLAAQGKHPSVDAVRIALGNTGSKTTIHKYLKELESEEGGLDTRSASVSEAIQDLVERLARQLQSEADVRIDTARTEFEENAQRHLTTLTTAQKEIEQLQAKHEQIETLFQQERQAHSLARESLQKEEIARHTAEQQVADLRERLTDKEAHCQSLEDKHRHAYEALEHYRQSVKDQRDQDQRRHEQQVQQLQAELRTAQQTIIVKQEDITRLNKEGARFVGDLAHAREALHDVQESLRKASQRLEALQLVEEKNRGLMAQAKEWEKQTRKLTEQIADKTKKMDALGSQVRELELALAQSQARHELQQGIMGELRSYLENRPLSAPPPA